MITRDEVIEWVELHSQHLLDALRDCKDIPDSAKDSFKDCWCAGYFLNEALKKAGASSELRRKIAFIIGQRCARSDPYDWAAFYLNEYMLTGDVSDNPGLELASKIEEEFNKSKG